MTVNDVLIALRNFDAGELRTINGALVTHLKAINQGKAADKKRELYVGKEVSWTGRRGFQSGTITKVKRVKVDVRTDYGELWTVPMAMLD